VVLYELPAGMGRSIAGGGVHAERSTQKPRFSPQEAGFYAVLDVVKPVVSGGFLSARV